MAKKVMELHSLIHSKFTSEAECARILEERFPDHNWNKNKLNKYTNGKAPGVLEANDLSKVLGVTVDEIADIFLRYKSPNGDKLAS